jgi:hypothetical protein
VSALVPDRQLRKPRRPATRPAAAAQRCSAPTLAGSACGFDARNGTPFCLMHRNWQPPVTAGADR